LAAIVRDVVLYPLSTDKFSVSDACTDCDADGTVNPVTTIAKVRNQASILFLVFIPSPLCMHYF
jgi:hypothetical protein